MVCTSDSAVELSSPARVPEHVSPKCRGSISVEHPKLSVVRPYDDTCASNRTTYTTRARQTARSIQSAGRWTVRSHEMLHSSPLHSSLAPSHPHTLTPSSRRSPLVGSSSMSSDGDVTSSMPTASRLRSPPLMPRILTPPT